MIDRRQAEAAFYAYTSHYDSDNSMIRHKIEHTLRVAGNCERIAVSLRVDDDDAAFAWFLGLLHDIGRFEQVRRYGTFVDSVSVDHAEFGADLLFKDGLIHEFPAQGLSPDRLALLETAIRLHNKLTLPGDQDEETRCFCDLIRDADKADIFRVVTELSFEERAGTSKGLLQETEGAGDAVMECVLQHRCVPRDLRKTRFDVCISHCCMAFELVYPESRKIVREQGCLSRLITGRDADGKPLYSAKERGQMSTVRKEIEAAWGESLETK
ncbi:MAG: HD domain-containing protein [Eubacteriales bacterium]